MFSRGVINATVVNKKLLVVIKTNYVVNFAARHSITFDL